MTQEEEQTQEVQPQKKEQGGRVIKYKKHQEIRLGVGSLVLLVFCSFLLIVSTFLQLDITHFIIPSKLFAGEPTKLSDYIYTYKFIPQIPAVMFVVGLLGRRLGITSILLYIITGLFFLPVFALLLPKCVEFICQLRFAAFGRPKFGIGKTHGCRQMVIRFGVEALQRAQQFFCFLAFGVAVVRAGVFQRVQVKLVNHTDDFRLAVI